MDMIWETTFKTFSPMGSFALFFSRLMYTCSISLSFPLSLSTYRSLTVEGTCSLFVAAMIFSHTQHGIFLPLILCILFSPEFVHYLNTFGLTQVKKGRDLKVLLMDPSALQVYFSISLFYLAPFFVYIHAYTGKTGL